MSSVPVDNMESAEAEEMDAMRAGPDSDDPVTPSNSSAHMDDNDYNAASDNGDGQMISKAVKHIF